MRGDEILEKIRRSRLAMDKECNRHPDSFFDYFQKKQSKFPKRLVRYGPKPALDQVPKTSLHSEKVSSSSTFIEAASPPTEGKQP